MQASVSFATVSGLSVRLHSVMLMMFLVVMRLRSCCDRNCEGGNQKRSESSLEHVFHGGFRWRNGKIGIARQSNFIVTGPLQNGFLYKRVSLPSYKRFSYWRRRQSIRLAAGLPTPQSVAASLLHVLES